MAWEATAIAWSGVSNDGCIRSGPLADRGVRAYATSRSWTPGFIGYARRAIDRSVSESLPTSQVVLWQTCPTAVGVSVSPRRCDAAPTLLPPDGYGGR